MLATVCKSFNGPQKPARWFHNIHYAAPFEMDLLELVSLRAGVYIASGFFNRVSSTRRDADTPPSIFGVDLHKPLRYFTLAISIGKGHAL